MADVVKRSDWLIKQTAREMYQENERERKSRERRSEMIALGSDIRHAADLFMELLTRLDSDREMYSSEEWAEIDEAQQYAVDALTSVFAEMKANR